MRATLYRYDGPGFLRPQFHIVTDEALPDCAEEVRLKHEVDSGAPVTVRKVATAQITRAGRMKRAARWLVRRAEG